MQITKMDSQSSNIKKFTLGLLAGLFIAGIFWLYSIYFHVPISLAQGIIGSSLLAISCGVIATVSGIDKLFDNFPNI
ncbi:MAG: hypothetical protein AAGM40_29060 [Cyanobacteria bacterium J06573_2]